MPGMYQRQIILYSALLFWRVIYTLFLRHLFFCADRSVIMAVTDVGISTIPQLPRGYVAGTYACLALYHLRVYAYIRHLLDSYWQLSGLRRVRTSRRISPIFCWA